MNKKFCEKLFLPRQGAGTGAGAEKGAGARAGAGFYLMKNQII